MFSSDRMKIFNKTKKQKTKKDLCRSNKMKILQISSVPIDYPGGTEKVVLELSKELMKQKREMWKNKSRI